MKKRLGVTAGEFIERYTRTHESEDDRPAFDPSQDARG